MGHSVETSPFSARQQAIKAQKRIGSFVLVFSVALMILTISFSAIQYRDAPCQHRAHEMVYEVLLVPTCTREEIVNLVEMALNAINVTLDDGNDSPLHRSLQTVVSLDTKEKTLSREGFHLIQEKSEGGYRYHLRAALNQLCAAHPRVSMEMLPNVDYEKASYRIRSLSDANRSLAFVFESTLNTNDGSRFDTFPQVQRVYPGLYEFSASPIMVVLGTWSSNLLFMAQLYYSGVPLDIQVHLRRWVSGKEQPLLWRLTVTSENIISEGNLQFLAKELQAAFHGKNMTCGSRDCGNSYNSFLF